MFERKVRNIPFLQRVKDFVCCTAQVHHPPAWLWLFCTFQCRLPAIFTYFTLKCPIIMIIFKFTLSMSTCFNAKRKTITVLILWNERRHIITFIFQFSDSASCSRTIPPPSETLCVRYRLFKGPLLKSPVCSDWSVFTGLSRRHWSLFHISSVGAEGTTRGLRSFSSIDRTWNCSKITNWLYLLLTR